MTELSYEALRELATKAVHDLVGPEVAMHVDVDYDPDPTDHSSCYFIVRLSDEVATALPRGMFRINLLDRLHARLIEAGDTRYPYLKVFGFYPLSQLTRA
jgi:hypothetical protein